MLLIHRPQDGEIDYTCSRSKASFLKMYIYMDHPDRHVVAYRDDCFCI